jgi:hypothetical protein
VDSSFAVFATGCLAGAIAAPASLLLADAFANKVPEDAKRSSRQTITTRVASEGNADELL